MKNENRFFSEIEDVLHSHEDAYMEGAWESFVAKRKRRRGLVWFRLAGAAAALLLFSFVAAQFFIAKPKQEHSYQTKVPVKTHQDEHPIKQHDSLKAVVPQQNNIASDTRTSTPKFKATTPDSFAPKNDVQFYPPVI